MNSQHAPIISQERYVNGKLHPKGVDPFAGNQVNALFGIQSTATQESPSPLCTRPSPFDTARYDRTSLGDVDSLPRRPRGIGHFFTHSCHPFLLHLAA